MTEIWRAVVGFEEIYEVSNLGVVRRIKDGGTGAKAGDIIHGSKYSNGYIVVKLRKDNRIVRKGMHQLVAAAFIGPCPAGMEVNHQDGIKSNNWIDNLEYVTASANRQHAYDTNLHPKGEFINTAKLTQDQVKQIRLLYRTGQYTYEQLADQFKVHFSNIGYIIRNKIWSWL